MGRNRRRGRRERAQRSQSSAHSESPTARFDVGFCILLGVFTFVAFGALLHNDFIRYDDTLYVTENSRVQSGLSLEGFRWALTTRTASNWHPLTWLSHMLDAELFGLSPEGHHLSSLLLHLANGLLLFGMLRWTTGTRWRSAFVTALFALHPMHVESVAWIAERKDVLSTMFWLLTMLAWARYTRDGRSTDYALTLVLFALGLMAKPMLVTLPCVLLLLDVWPLGRTRLAAAARPSGWSRSGGGRFHHPAWLIAEKLPLVALSVMSSTITLVAQRSGGAVKDTLLYPLGVRVATALVGYVAYVAKSIWPIDLSIFYLHPRSWPAWQVAGAATVLLAVSLLVLRLGRRRPYLAVGWFWYLGTLVPVIGMVQVGFQWMADRYSYVPSIGLFIAVVWGLGDLIPARRRAAAVAAGVAVLLLCGLATRRQVAYWKDTSTLFGHAIALDADNFPAHLVLADFLMHEGRVGEAIAHYDAAVQVEPGYGPARYKLGTVLVRQGRADRALPHLEASYRLQPEHAETRFYLGLAHERGGDHRRAAEYYREGLELKPADTEARTRLGITLNLAGNPREAIEELRVVLERDPQARAALRYLAVLLATVESAELRDVSAAVRMVERSAALGGGREPLELEALAIVYAAAGRFEEAAQAADRLSQVAEESGDRELAASAARRARLYRSHE
jgi:tetratricopeptide (TPR) repeat protein